MKRALLALALALPALAQFTPPYNANGGSCGTLAGDVTGTCAANSIKPSVGLTGNPTSTTQAVGDATTDIATDSHVAAALASLNPAVAVQAATIAVLSNTPVYANGSAGVGATLTAGSFGALTIDGYAVLLNDRVLIKNQGSAFQNGVYTLTTLGTGGVDYILTRATDYNSTTNINYTGTIPVLQGSTLAVTGWNLQTQVAAIGTDPLNYTQAAAANAGGPPGGNVKGVGALTNNAPIIGQGGKSIAAIPVGTTGQILQSNGGSTPPSWANPVYTQTFTSQTSVALAHTLGTVNIIVQCYNSATPAVNIEWNTLTLTNTNTATVTFTNAQSGICIVAGTAAGGGGGGGGGSGTVNAGTAGQFAYYQSGGTAVSGQSWMQSPSFSATPTFDLSLGSPKMTLTANVTSITFSNPTNGQPYFIELCQNGTGAWTAAPPTGFGAFMTIGATASKCSSQNFHYDGANYIADSPGVINQ